MPVQETFFTQQIGDRKVEVIKTYDEAFAREVFDGMDEAALKHLWDALKLGDTYEADDLPVLGALGGEAEAFLWDELAEQAFEDRRAYPATKSFFVVLETDAKRTDNRYVSADWPSAESYAKGLLVRS
jgi:hypothetical protein